MQRIYLFILLLLTLSLVACGKSDYELSAHIFEDYETTLTNLGYDVFEIDKYNVRANWMEIKEKDLVSIHRASKDDLDGVAYIYLFPTIKKAKKWYEIGVEYTLESNYEIFINDHYVVITLGTEITNIFKNKNS